jgi:hypothetical protein
LIPSDHALGLPAGVIVAGGAEEPDEDFLVALARRWTSQRTRPGISESSSACR